MVLALPTPPTLLRLPPLAVVVVVLAGVAELRLAVLEERDALVPELLERLAVLVPVLLEREVLTPEREELELVVERLAELPERLLKLVLLLERVVLALEREELELVLELERLMVPPIALELLDEELIELREELEEEELLDALEPEEEEERLLELLLEVERLLPEPPLDWALTGAIASAIAAMAASAILNVVFIMLNFKCP